MITDHEGAQEQGAIKGSSREPWDSSSSQQWSGLITLSVVFRQTRTEAVPCLVAPGVDPVPFEPILWLNTGGLALAVRPHRAQDSRVHCRHLPGQLPASAEPAGAYRVPGRLWLRWTAPQVPGSRSPWETVTCLSHSGDSNPTHGESGN